MTRNAITPAIESWLNDKLSAVSTALFAAAPTATERHALVAAVLAPLGLTVTGGSYGCAGDIGYSFTFVSPKGGKVQAYLEDADRGVVVVGWNSHIG